jgi:hypothetical protein
MRTKANAVECTCQEHLESVHVTLPLHSSTTWDNDRISKGGTSQFRKLYKSHTDALRTFGILDSSMPLIDADP